MEGYDQPCRLCGLPLRLPLRALQETIVQRVLRFCEVRNHGRPLSLWGFCQVEGGGGGASRAAVNKQWHSFDLSCGSPFQKKEAVAALKSFLILLWLCIYSSFHPCRWEHSADISSVLLITCEGTEVLAQAQGRKLRHSDTKGALCHRHHLAREWGWAKSRAYAVWVLGFGTMLRGKWDFIIIEILYSQ